MDKIVLYGAGRRGKGIYEFLKKNGYEDLVFGFCDINADKLGEICGKKVYKPFEIEEGKYIYCITLLDEKERNKIKEMMVNEKTIDFSELPNLLGLDKVKFNRDFCAFYHIEGMNQYFKDAEQGCETFWSSDSVFYKCFQELNLDKVIEIACGRGRHVPYYIEKANEVVLVDILQENIDYCKERFKNETKIKYYKNDGYDLKALESNYYTAVYSYDAMVHFEMQDIWSYLKEIYRVLQYGGMALIHHSNYDLDYKADFTNAPDSRNYMNKQLFAYLAYRAGLKIKFQKVIDWGENPDLDCISLLQK